MRIRWERAGTWRIITEDGTNILAIGIDNRDFYVVRFYFQGTNQFEIRADQILAKDRLVLPPKPPPALLAERDALLDSISRSTNAVDFTPLALSGIVSNLTRLRQLDERIANPAR